MKKNIIALWGIAAVIATSCTTVTNTSSTSEVQPVVVQRPTVADLEVDTNRVEGRQEWNWTFLHRFTDPSLKLRKQNLVADMLRERNADVLVEPQVSYTQKMFGKRTLSIVGYPARLRNFHSASQEELRDLGLLATGCDGNHALCSSQAERPVQVASSESESRATERQRHWYLRIGPNFMNMTGSNADDFGGKLGYDFVAGWQTNIGKSAFYYAVELGLGSRGFTCTSDGYFDDRYNEKRYQYKDGEHLMTHNVHVSPFNFGYRLGLSGKLKLDAHVGAFYSYDYKGYENIRGERLSWRGENSGNDVGLRLGVGAWYGRYNLDLTWQRGFLEKFDAVETSNLMLRVGVAF